MLYIVQDSKIRTLHGRSFDRLFFSLVAFRVNSNSIVFLKSIEIDVVGAEVMEVDTYILVASALAPAVGCAHRRAGARPEVIEYAFGLSSPREIFFPNQSKLSPFS